MIEKTSEITEVAVDKTGTLTKGCFDVVGRIPMHDANLMVETLVREATGTFAVAMRANTTNTAAAQPMKLDPHAPSPQASPTMPPTPLRGPSAASETSTDKGRVFSFASVKSQESVSVTATGGLRAVTASIAASVTAENTPSGEVVESRLSSSVAEVVMDGPSGSTLDGAGTGAIASYATIRELCARLHTLVDPVWLEGLLLAGTGGVTNGKEGAPVTDTEDEHREDRVALKYAAALEEKSAHPVASAIVAGKGQSWRVLCGSIAPLWL